MSFSFTSLAKSFEDFILDNLLLDAWAFSGIDFFLLALTSFSLSLPLDVFASLLDFDLALWSFNDASLLKLLLLGLRLFFDGLTGGAVVLNFAFDLCDCSVCLDASVLILNFSFDFLELISRAKIFR